MDSVDVVVVDDNEGVCWVLKEMLSAEGITCRVARSSREGLDLVGRYRPRLALIDIKLGAVNGLDLARRICENNCNIKIIFITGYKEVVPDTVWQTLPVVGVVAKPFDVAQLLGLIRKALQLESRVAEINATYH